MTPPRWIAEALDAVAWDQGRSFAEMSDAVATALIERLPMEAMVDAIAVLPSTREACASMVAKIVSVLTDGDPEVVSLTELYQGACKALDDAGVPYAQDPDDGPTEQLTLATRIRWLAQQRPTRLDLQRVEAERDEARSERDQLQRMYEGASDDLHRERTSLQDAESAAATRELALTVDLDNARAAAQELKAAVAERNTTIRALVESDMPAGDLRLALAGMTGFDDWKLHLVDLDRDALRRKVADQAGYIEALELELEALEDQIDRLDSNPDLPDMWTGCKVGAP